MYEDAKRYREQMKAKAHRMAEGDPRAKVDSSDWTPAEPANMDVQTGERPISRRQYTRGGHVEGEHAMQRADRRPRKSGGFATELVNRDVKAANEERAGTKHIGGFASGGNAGDMVPQGLLPSQSTSSRLSKAAGLATGGRTSKAIGGDLAVLSPALMLANGLRGDKDKDAGSAQVVGKKAGGSADGSVSGTPISGGRTPRANGGRAEHPHWIKEAIGHPGALHRALHVPEGEKIPAKKVAKAAHSDNPHLRREAQLAETLKGMHRAERASGGRTKGKVNVNVIIAQPGSEGRGAEMPQGMPPAMEAGPMRPPMPPPGPVGPPKGMPPGLAAAGPSPGAPPPMPMPRRRGGPACEAGAGSGEGRLEKIKHYGAKA